MSALNENSLALLGRATGVDMQTAQANDIFTVPVGKVAYITHVVIRNPSASMAGGASYSLTNWKQAFSLVSLTTLGTDYIVLDSENTKYAELAAETDFQITVTTGTTAACTADIDVFGFLV